MSQPSSSYQREIVPKSLAEQALKGLLEGDETKDQVDFCRKEYKDSVPFWTRCRTVAKGGDAVKEAGATYLPMLVDQEYSEYQGYLTRAVFFEATGRTIAGCLGGLFRRNPTIKAPIDEPEKYLDRLPVGSKGFVPFLQSIAQGVLETGRVGVLVDLPSTGGSPYLVKYETESIINWRERTSTGDSKDSELELVVLREKHPVYGKYVMGSYTVYRVLRLNERGNYTFQLWKEDEENTAKKTFIAITKEEEITKNGVPLKFIPFYWINSRGNKAEVPVPPMLGLVDINLAHYRNSADLENGRHFTGIPTAWVAGFDPSQDNKLHIGSQYAWVSDDPQAKAGYLEFTGQGLKTLENGLQEKAGMMQVLGGRLLESQTPNVESAETHKLRRFGESSVLGTIASAISLGVSNAVNTAAWWEGISDERFEIIVQKDFDFTNKDPALLKELIGGLQAGAISQETFFENAKKMGVYEANDQYDEEHEKIESGAYSVSVQAALLNNSNTGG